MVTNAARKFIAEDDDAKEEYERILKILGRISLWVSFKKANKPPAERIANLESSKPNPSRFDI